MGWSDGAGVVTEVGDGVDPSWMGREVIVNPALDWGHHERAQEPRFSILGLPKDGTLAEAIHIPVGQLAPKPAHLTWEEAAALPLALLARPPLFFFCLRWARFSFLAAAPPAAAVRKPAAHTSGDMAG